MSMPPHRPFTARRRGLIQAFRPLLNRIDYAGVGFPNNETEQRIVELCVRQGLLFRRPQGEGEPCGYTTTTTTNQALAGQLIFGD